MKLELKHLFTYLPYGLKFIDKTGTYLEFIMAGLTSKAIISTNLGHYSYATYLKPILHPLSDLTKEIEVNGEKFVPLGVFYEMYGGGASSKNQFEADYYDNIIYTPYKSLSYETVQKLFEWHFDLHNLIKNGLAVDINTLNK